MAKKVFDDKPLFSIITVVYNGEKYLEQTILSVLNQTYDNFEYIIVDGGSQDNTLDIIKKYDNSIHTWISESDNGIYDAINKGITLSRGILVGIVNSDDYLESKSLQIIADNFFKYPEIDVFHGILRFLKNDSYYMLRGSLSNSLSDGLIEHPTFFIKREIYKRYGMYSLEYKSASDLDFAYTLIKNNCKFLLIPHIISNFRMGGISDSYIGFYETIRIRRKYKYLSKKKYLIELFKLLIKRYLLLF